MSHVDEGALHAYLDGALDEYPGAEARRIREHLDGCAECAARLEEERRLRHDASTILGLAVPDVEAPSFEELKAYVRATRPAPSPGAVRLYRLGWAASVVVALGVGWLARDGQLDRSSGPGAPEASSVAERPTEQTGGATAALAPQDPSGRDADQAARRDAEGLASGSGDPVSRDVGLTRQASRDVAVEESFADADVLPAPDEEVAVGAELAGQVFAVDRVAGPEVAEPPVASAQPVAPTELDETRPRTAESLERGLGGAASTLARLPADPPPETTAVASPSSPAAAGAALEREEQRSREAGARATDGPQARAARLEFSPAVGPDLQAAPEAAESDGEADDEAPLSVPDVEVLSITSLGEGTTRIGVHIEQRLDGGTTLDVYHLESGIDPSVLPPLRPARNELRVERDDGWIVVRAAVAPETLRALLARLVPEG